MFKFEETTEQKKSERLEKILIVFEEHHARHTDASSRFEFEPEPIVEPIDVGGGTHRKYMTVVYKGTMAKLIRVSNKGNVWVKKITIDSPMFIDFLGNVSELPEDYVEYAMQLKII
ncbi:MAG: hypothetical protein QXT67_04925 [Candidatus Bathyarchaeia archaeon]